MRLTSLVERPARADPGRRPQRPSTPTARPCASAPVSGRPLSLATLTETYRIAEGAVPRIGAGLVRLLRRQRHRRGAGKRARRWPFWASPRSTTASTGSWRCCPMAGPLPGTRSTPAARSSLTAIPRPKAARHAPERAVLMPDLLIELFSEEIPARMQGRAAEDLRKLVTDGLVEAGLTYAGRRRLFDPAPSGAVGRGADAEVAARARRAQGPRRSARRKRPSTGFLRSTGLTRDQLETRDDKKGQVYFAVIEQARPQGARDHRRSAGAGDPDLPLAEIHALGRRHPALGAAAALDHLPAWRRKRGRGRAADGRRHRRRRHRPKATGSCRKGTFASPALKTTRPS